MTMTGVTEHEDRIFGLKVLIAALVCINLALIVVFFVVGSVWALTGSGLALVMVLWFWVLLIEAKDFQEAERFMAELDAEPWYGRKGRR